MRVFVLAIALVLPSTAFGLPDETDFHVATNVPQPAPSASGVVGCSLPDGRYLLWNGDIVFIQRAAGSGVFDPVATGYVGDPAFAIRSFDQDYVLLGAGFGNGVTANLYPFDFDSPQDYQSGDEIVAPNHYSAAFLTSTLIAIDRGDFGSPAEIVVIDVSTARSARPPAIVLRRPESISRDTIITKPGGSFSASVSVKAGIMYVADSGNGQYKSFAVSDIINAYNASSSVAWSSGTDIGTPFAYPLGGVSGVTAGGNLVVAGFGSIAVVDPGTGAVVTSYDPAGTGPFYGIVYNDGSEDFIAIEFPASFGDPLIFHATADGVPALPASSAAGITSLALCVAALATWGIRNPLTAEGAR